MHGGVVYLRGEANLTQISPGHVTIRRAGEDDLRQLQPHLQEFCAEFGLDADAVAAGPFVRLAPLSHRPYSDKYAA